MGILTPGDYPHTYAMAYVCVGMGILKPRHYSQTAAKAQVGRLM